MLGGVPAVLRFGLFMFVKADGQGTKSTLPKIIGHTCFSLDFGSGFCELARARRFEAARKSLLKMLMTSASLDLYSWFEEENRAVPLSMSCAHT
ncbi:MAG: hypothetical protein RL156_1367 [Bacteroidota bacterium]|jgi:hypothetical protein